MKQTLLKAVFFASILLVATSCNDDDDDNGGGNTQPSFTFKGNTFDLTTNETVEWSATSVMAEVSLFGELTIKAVKGTDTLSILVSGVEEGFYPIESNTALSSGNYFVDVNPADTVFFTLDGTTDTGGLLTITALDTINQTFDGEFTTFYTNPDSSELFFSFQEGVLENIPFTVETFDVGELGGTVTANADGAPVTFDTVLAFDLLGTLSISASNSTSGGFPVMSLNFSSSITPGSYNFGGISGNAATYATSGTANYVSTSGTLEILTNSDGNVTGNFSFTALNAQNSNTIEITNGSFDIDY